jgi:hypothetical protein
VHLAFSCRALFEAVGAAERLWRAHCEKMGWSLAWLATLPADGAPTAWRYFCRRIAVRHRLRRQLRILTRYLAPSFAGNLRPTLGLRHLREAEAALQVGRSRCPARACSAPHALSCRPSGTLLPQPLAPLPLPPGPPALGGV